MAISKPNPLAMGFYTISEATKLIENGSRQRIYGWLKGYSQTKAGPLLKRDYEPIGGKHELSFLDLIEVRFVEFFRDEGVKPYTLRLAAENARKVLKVQHPFATDFIKFKTDHKEIYVEEIFKRAAEQANDPRLWNLCTSQYESYHAIRETIEKSVTFDPKTHLAGKWHPRNEDFPKIAINPFIAYGKPAGPSGIPTETLFESWEAEKRDGEAVAYWFDINLGEVEQAVAFEQKLNQELVQAA